MRSGDNRAKWSDRQRRHTPIRSMPIGYRLPSQPRLLKNLKPDPLGALPEVRAAVLTLMRVAAPEKTVALRSLPILDLEPRHARKLVHVAGDYHSTERQSMRSDDCVSIPDLPPGPL